MNEPAPPGPLLVDVAGQRLSAEDRRLLADPAVGGVILFTRNYSEPGQLGELTAEIRSLRANLLLVADQEGGRVQRFCDGFTKIPPMRALGRLHARDPEGASRAACDLGWLVASELRSTGIDMPLAPVTDLDYGVSQDIGSRSFAQSPDVVTMLAGAFAGGLAEAGSSATIKHFPGHGYVAADSHVDLPSDDRTLAELEHDWAPFAALIKQGVSSVMMAHVRYPAVDELPASLSPRWIKDILRMRLGFTGCVFCDDLSMSGAAVLGDYAKRTRLALAAGCDYLPVCNDRAGAWQACRTVAVAGEAHGTAKRRALLASVAGGRAGCGAQATRLARARASAVRLGYCSEL
jgi:beta-N-acetylhexosaminidase